MKDTRGKSTPVRSTGPTSPAGKQSSSQNSTSHGMRSNVVRLLPGESSEEMDAMRAMWESQYGRYVEGNAGMALLLCTLGDADWVQRRCTRLFSEVMAQLVEAEAGDADEERLAKLEKKLTLWTRYKTSAENSFQRALRAVEQFLARRRRESMQQQKIVVKVRETADKIASKMLKEGRFEPVHAIEAKPDAPVEKQPDAGGGGA
ncbi:MAG: hypothetical protein M3Y72_14225 [Acidobacteriota bacterium]|nr:hypothetical protein [Acidobacteriota bacterium]